MIVHLDQALGTEVEIGMALRFSTSFKMARLI